MIIMINPPQSTTLLSNICKNITHPPTPKYALPHPTTLLLLSYKPINRNSSSIFVCICELVGRWTVFICMELRLVKQYIEGYLIMSLMFGECMDNDIYNLRMSFSKRLRNLDIFKKVPSELSQASNIGGCISIITAIMIVFFSYVQFRNYFNPEYIAEINMDSLFTREEMTVNIDISFPSFPCELISLDLEDVMISHHPNIGSIEKWRLDKNGNYLDRRSYQLLRQRNPQKQLEEVREALRNQYGCRLIGSFTVKEVPGNFHVSCHGYFNHFMQMKMEGHLSSLNTSHIIHKLYFGNEHHLNTIKSRHPEAALHLLQNKTVVETQGRSIHYHLDIVPTWYKDGTISNYYTYQYTYKENAYEGDDQPEIVHFNYAIGGLIVEIMPRGEDLSTFLIHLCGILGGTYAIMQAAHNLLSNFTQKFEYQLIE